MDPDQIKDLIEEEILKNLRISIRGPHCSYGNSGLEMTVVLSYRGREVGGRNPSRFRERTGKGIDVLKMTP